MAGWQGRLQAPAEEARAWGGRLQGAVFRPILGRHGGSFISLFFVLRRSGSVKKQEPALLDRYMCVHPRAHFHGRATFCGIWFLRGIQSTHL